MNDEAIRNAAIKIDTSFERVQFYFQCGTGEKVLSAASRREMLECINRAALKGKQMNTTTEALPEPEYYERKGMLHDIDPINDPTFNYQKLYTSTQMHAYAAKCCAERDADIERLKDALIGIDARATAALKGTI